MGERDYASETHSTMFIIGEKQDEEESDPSQLDQSESSVESAVNEDEQINDNKFDFAKKWRPPKSTIVNEREVAPLTAFVYDINQFGNLTITFNKPIIVPRMIINNENRTIGFSGRQLTD